ncbi:GntR family transcriptional regulator [Agrococcus sp. Marseille-P2731]|uniref:GntR family transcriptional regulator n=1 Tax=Agrococcus sp. Marseille-P2731 TaxID=1841862 RepID=UPI00092FDA35|nr:GntR family transcriptional regulator [Agrococcus sp. Marseille-P2731]
MRIVISTSSAEPIYQQIKQQATSAILSGAVAPGATLPSLRQLAADLRVSVITVTRAYNDLVAAGLVRNEHGRGFVVLEVDPSVAARGLDERFTAALQSLCTTGREARMTIDDIHRRLDEAWNEARRQHD